MFIVGVCVGDWQISLDKIIPSALGQGHPLDVFMVRDVRLPRVLTGLAVGAALGLSGAVFQSLARNPLASPDILGITAGATFAGALRVCAEAPSGANVLCMLPDTGERYLSTPLFAEVPAEMTDEELQISRSTPSAQFAA